MSSGICLVVIYNHNFEKNIPIVKRMYSGRFTSVFQVMPFYRGSDPSVIGVYESSYQYNGYITQAAHRLVPTDMSQMPSHYVFVADDMVLNPSLNEDNILNFLKIGVEEAFHPGYWAMTSDALLKWYWGLSSVVNVCCTSNACEWKAALPSVDVARRIFDSKGIDWRKMVSRQDVSRIFGKLKVRFENPYCIQPNDRYEELKKLVRDDPSEERIYPLVRGFSDFFVVPGQAMSDFCHYCGVFAAMRAFVETAVPTSLVLCCAKVKTLKDCGLQAESGVATNEIREQIFAHYHGNYRELCAGFPANMLYVHPVKLSKWSHVE